MRGKHITCSVWCVNCFSKLKHQTRNVRSDSDLTFLVSRYLSKVQTRRQPRNPLAA